MRTAPRHTTTKADPQAAPVPTTHDTPTTPTTPTEREVPAARRPTIGFGTTIAVTAALAAAVVAIVLAIAPSVAPPGEEAPPQDEAAALERLVRLGYLPGEALEPVVTEDVLTRRLQATGRVPTGPAPTTVPALGPAAEERVALRALVDRGLVPAAALQPTTEDAHLQNLIARGLVPEGS